MKETCDGYMGLLFSWKKIMIDDFQKGLNSYTNASIGDEPIDDAVTKFEQNYKTWHVRLSLIKSTIRIFTCALAISYAMLNSTLTLMILAFGLLIAECVGIIEEL